MDRFDTIEPCARLEAPIAWRGLLDHSHRCVSFVLLGVTSSIAFDAGMDALADVPPI